MKKPLAAAGERLKGKPGRPRKLRPEAEVVTVPPRLLDLAGAARYLGVSPWTVRDLEADGKVQRVRIPYGSGRSSKRKSRFGEDELRKLLFDREDLDRLVERWKEGGR